MSSGKVPAGRRASDRGGVLVLVLVFVVVFGAVITGLLNYADSQLKVFQQFRTQRSQMYAAAGATDAAIQYLRYNKTRGAFGTTCPTFTLTINSVPATVTCTNTGTARNIDRPISLVASAGGKQRISTTVIYRDSSVIVGALPTVDVVTWNYLR